MKERPILFSAPMVRAILSGQKTQTRRIAKPVRHPDFGNEYTSGALVLEHEPQHVIERACPYGQPGDRLWVREAWRASLAYELTPPRDIPPGEPIVYQADGAGSLPHFNAGKLRPSMFMPRWASRITLEIAGVRVQRLQDISTEDALAEGVNVHPDFHGKPASSIYSPFQAFRDLWQSINSPDSWAENPLVWAVEFRRLA